MASPTAKERESRNIHIIKEEGRFPLQRRSVVFHQVGSRNTWQGSSSTTRGEIEDGDSHGKGHHKGEVVGTHVRPAERVLEGEQPSLLFENKVP